MYLDYEVKNPDSRHGITRKTIRGITYIYYAYDRKYSLERYYTVPKNTTIGRCLDASAETMYPNTNFLKYFLEAELPETQEITDRSAGLFLDLVAYPSLQKTTPVSTIRIMPIITRCLRRG